MFQQHTLRWLDGLRVPRVGLGALGLATGAAFVAGALIAALLVGVGSTATRTAAPVVPAPLAVSHPGQVQSDLGALPGVIVRSGSAPAPRSGPSVGDFGTPPQAVGNVGSAPAPRSGPSVGDFGTPPSGGSVATAPQRYSGPSVADFGTPPSGN